MNWYLTSKFLEQFKPQSLKGLAAEALKTDTLEEFEKDYLVQIKHGTYWHITDNPNFQINPNLGPRDMSSMAAGEMTKGALMVTSHLENWVSEYPDRKYAAEIDMSNVDRKDYYQVKRGFGNEFFITNPTQAKVVRVVPIQQALRINRYRHGKIPNSYEDLQSFYQRVQQGFTDFEKASVQNTVTTLPTPSRLEPHSDNAKALTNQHDKIHD